MAFLRTFFSKSRKKKDYPFITRDVDPEATWEIVGKLGDGAFGEVFKAQSKNTGQLAAAKIVEINEEDELDDFSVEINILSICEHPHVIQLMEAYYYNSKLWMLVEFCAGGAIDNAILDLDRGLKEPEIRAVAKQMFEALDYLHKNKVVHRDLKAGNILLMDDGTIKLADFGVSALNKKTRQKHDSFIGTPYWMAPEVVVCETSKEVPYDSKADIWSAGVTLIELGDTEPPHHEMHPMRVLFKIPKADPPTLTAPSHWSPELNDFIAKCLNKDQVARPTAEEMLLHPFIKDHNDHNDHKALMGLFKEVTAEVVTTVEDLPDDHTEVVLESGSSSVKSSVSTIPESSLESLDRSVVSHDMKKDVTDCSETIPNGTSAGYQEAVNDNKHTDDSASEGGQSRGRAGSLVSEDSGPSSVDSHLTEIPKLKSGSTKRKKKISTSGVLSAANAVPLATTGPRMESDPVQYKTLTRMRTFEVDGQTVTTTTVKVIDASRGETYLSAKQAQVMRRNELREVKLLQREEQKETQDLMRKVKQERETQEKTFDQEKQDLRRKCETDQENLSRQQKREVERLEQQQQQEERKLGKKLKDEQVKKLKKFKDSLKQQEKSLKGEVDKLPKAERKEALQRRLEELKINQQDRERDFHANLQEEFEQQTLKIHQEHKWAVKKMEEEFLAAKQDLVRGGENELWELEQQHLHERHQLAKHQLKEAFLMHRHQMHCRHEKELEQNQRRSQQNEEELLRKQNLEKKQMPKLWKNDSRIRLTEFRKGLRNQPPTNRPRDKEEERDRLKQFEAQELRKQKGEQLKMEMRHETEIQEIKTVAHVALDELKSLQVEKKQLLIQQETDKLREREEVFVKEQQTVKMELAHRKKKLEEDFVLQRQQQEKFYRGDTIGNSSQNSTLVVEET